jgi:hypothetical protein
MLKIGNSFHPLLMMNTNREGEFPGTAAVIETSIPLPFDIIEMMFTFLNRFRLVIFRPLFDFPIDPQEIIRVNNRKIQVGFRVHGSPDFGFRRDAESDLATPSKEKISGMNSSSFSHTFQEIAKIKTSREGGGRPGHQEIIDEKRSTINCELKKLGRGPDHMPLGIKSNHSRVLSTRTKGDRRRPVGSNIGSL